MSIGKRALSTDEYGNEFIDFPIEWEINNVPHSTFPYDSVFPTGFIMDMNLKEALSELSKLKSSIEVEKRGIEVIERLYDEGKVIESNNEPKNDLIIKSN